MNKRYFLFGLFVFLSVLHAAAQFVQGVVSDAATGETLPTVHVYYQDDKSTVVQTDINGKYKIAFRKGKLSFSMMGFETQIVEVKASQKLNVKLHEKASSLQEVTVTKKRTKYQRKNNPAVDMMRKVIAAKKSTDLRQNDYLSYNKYEKMVFALNEFTEKVFQDDHFKHFPFLKEHVETCPETGKLILPLTIDEKSSRIIYRKDPHEEKTIVVGERSEGVTNLINTGEIVNGMLSDCFQDIDIYKDQVRLFQYPFNSPISDGAVGFYRYFIVDTTFVDKQKCYKIEYTPNNPQDFGFSGALYILADSTWRVKRAEIGIPSRSDVNFVEQMDVVQDFEPLPTGEQVVVNNKMLVQMKLASWIQKMQVERVVKYSQWDFAPIPDRTFKFKGDTKTEASAQMRDEEFWEEQRPSPLTKSEGQMSEFMDRIQNIKGFKQIVWVGKAFIENFVETSINPEHPSKVDIGPINTMFTQNFVEGFKLRASAQTTANLNPHLFLKGYAGYGFGDKRWKGLGEVTYAFNKKAYLPREFPKNNLTASYFFDVIAPSDRFIQTDKDNVFTSLKWTKVDHMTYVQRMQLQWDREWENGMHLITGFRRERAEGAGKLFFQRLNTATSNGQAGMPSQELMSDPAYTTKYITSSEFSAGFEYQPNAAWINTKQRRLKLNYDSPIMGVKHTVGVKGLVGGDYNCNLTEFTFYKRFWLHSWGKFDAYAHAQCQWNQVPFTMLGYPLANLSYIMEDYTFNLIDNMEFITDRNATLLLSWDLNGKILNRVPLLRELKWREYLGCNLYWGYLSPKNNPFLERNRDNSNLYYFPGHYNADGTFSYTSQVMDVKKPYVELIFGIHNIFKLLHVEYVHRMNYITPDTQRWGIRFMFRASF